MDILVSENYGPVSYTHLLRVNVAPELCFAYREQAYAIKLFFSSGDKKISKNEADVFITTAKEQLYCISLFLSLIHI